jgi:hypothetical protein
MEVGVANPHIDAVVTRSSANSDAAKCDATDLLQAVQRGAENRVPKHT